MTPTLFINLPVRDVARSQAFYGALGFAIDGNFCSGQSACVVLADNIRVMLLAGPYFASFTDKPVVDARDGTQVLNCLGCAGREQVDELVARAVAHGGKAHREPRDNGFMYGHGFEDPDGHIWELVHMAAAPPAAGVAG